MIKTISYLGLGTMGGGMAANLLKAGYQLTVWNRNPEKCEPFARKGAREQPDDTLRPIFTEADNLLRQAGGDSEARAIGPALLLTAADVRPCRHNREGNDDSD